ncbi:extracellular solute-binding protein [Leucobacter sp. L43]|uniref:extracellular solute-binding protein n=1 Tax=Leucobacter sp. L43 TaxID=2798040 RepID=UPI001907B955
MTGFRGLTWDHPRGRVWLEAASVLWRERGVDVSWDAQPLEGFEAHPIDELAAEYDLIVLDHPHIGDALRNGALQSLESVLGDDDPLFSERYVGPSLRSYRGDGGTWALPIDAATQVSARDSRLVAAAPETWEDVERLAADVPVALSLSGPHALLTFFSVVAALGAAPVDEAGEAWVPDREALDALEVLRAVQARSAPGYDRINPIGLLERVGSDDPLAFVPLVYGYVNYSRRGNEAPVAFGDAPRAVRGGPIGSMIGGTGVAVSRRAEVTDGLREYLRWLVAPSTQRRVIPEFEGQPALAGAWADREVDDRAGAFYSSTRDTIEAASVRPRYAGFPAAQLAGSELVRSALSGELAPREALARLGRLARDSRAAALKGNR